MRAEWFECGRGWMADFFLRPPILTASNFEALSPTDSIFQALTDLSPFQNERRFKRLAAFLGLVLLSQTPHLHRAYLVTVHEQKSMTVYK